MRPHLVGVDERFELGRQIVSIDLRIREVREPEYVGFGQDRLEGRYLVIRHELDTHALGDSALCVPAGSTTVTDREHARLPVKELELLVLGVAREDVGARVLANRAVDRLTAETNLKQAPGGIDRLVPVLYLIIEQGHRDEVASCDRPRVRPYPRQPAKHGLLRVLTRCRPSQLGNISPVWRRDGNPLPAPSTGTLDGGVAGAPGATDNSLGPFDIEADAGGARHPLIGQRHGIVDGIVPIAADRLVIGVLAED